MIRKKSYSWSLGSTPNKSADLFGPFLPSHQGDRLTAANSLRVSFYRISLPPPRNQCYPCQLSFRLRSFSFISPERGPSSHWCKSVSPRLPASVFILSSAVKSSFVCFASFCSTSGGQRVQLPFMNVHEQSLNVQPFPGEGGRLGDSKKNSLTR